MSKSKSNTMKSNNSSTKSNPGGKNYRGKGRKGIPGPIRGDATQKEKDRAVNDISWYAQYPELLAAAARIPFPYKAGMKVPIGDAQPSSTRSPHFGNFTLPGVMALHFMPSIGPSSGPTSPASITAKELWARVRSKFSGSLDEDPPDLFMYAIALDSMHSFIAEMKRVYRLLNMYTPYNRDYPENVLKALSINAAVAENWRINKMDLYGFINSCVRKANKFPLPKNMPLYDRHRFMNESIYLDSESVNSQSYIFVQDDYYVIDDTGSSGTELHSNNTATSLANVSARWASLNTLQRYFESMHSALSGWDDAYTIAGHIERAFEGETFYLSELIAQDEILNPVYNPVVLSQIENSRELSYTSLASITQDVTTNAILHSPSLGSTINVYPVMNLHIDNPTAADVVEASRLMAFQTNVSGQSIEFYGTEIVTAYYIATSDNANAIRTVPCSNADYETNFKYTRQLWAFRHAPICIGYSLDSGSTSVIDQFILCDFANFTTFTPDQLGEINTVCLYSQFNCFRK